MVPLALPPPTARITVLEDLGLEHAKPPPARPPSGRESPFWRIWVLKMPKMVIPAPTPRAGITILEDLGLENDKMVIPARVSLAPPCPHPRGNHHFGEFGHENAKMVTSACAPLALSSPPPPRGNHHFGRFGL